MSYGRQVYEKLDAVAGTVSIVKDVPHGSAVAPLAEMRLQRGDYDDPLSLTPLYLKESTAKAFINKYARKDS